MPKGGLGEFSSNFFTISSLVLSIVTGKEYKVSLSFSSFPTTLIVAKV